MRKDSVETVEQRLAHLVEQRHDRAMSGVSLSIQLAVENP